MRRNLIETDLVECVIGIGKNLFYNSPMEACIVICRTNKPANRRGKVLFINARHEVTRKNAQSYLEEKHIRKIAECYEKFISIEGFSAIASNGDIKLNQNKLSIALYVRGTDNSSEIVDCSMAIENWYANSENLHKEISTLTRMIGEGGNE